MTHARTILLDPAADPIHTAIARHRATWEAFQIAPEGDPSLDAEGECDAALGAMLGTACATRFGALALRDHLRWWLAEEAPNAEAYGEAWPVAQARAADLTLFLGTRPSVAAIPLAAPCGRLASERRLARALMLTGEALAAIAIIGGGTVLTGLATLL